jgi:peptidylprolyl isomerase
MNNRLALLALAGVLLTACSSTPAGVPGIPAADLPAVSGGFGADPVITMPNGDAPGRLVVQTLIPGGGPVVGASSYVMFNVEGKVWAGDREVVDSFTDHQPQGLPLTVPTIPAFRHLAGERVGSRVLMVIPPADGFGSAGDSEAGVTAGDTLVFVFDILATMPANAAASGTPVPYSPGRSLPAVRMTPTGPVITVPHGVKAPGNLVTRVLMRGSGPPIVSGDTVVVQYTGVVWRTGTVFDSSWQRKFPEAFQLGAGQVIPGWEQGLGGLPVGSRVLLIIPPGLGYGQSGYAPDVTATDTLVYVVDIVTAIR